MKIALIPIDNRPICYDLIQDILSIDKNIELFMPDIKDLGSLTKSADTDKLFKFIEKLNEIDCLIVCLDTLAYGGLIPSRRCEDSFSQIKERILKFKEIAEKKCKKILAFSSIMRISNNNINEEEKEYWSKYGKKIFDWSYNSHKNNDESLPQDIPKEIIEDYINTRKRNFEINKLYLDLSLEGFFDALIFSKDDCAQFGLNIKEADILEGLAKEKKAESVFIKTGADEIPLSLISRALVQNKNIKINPVFTEEESIDLISKYEDISIKDCVFSQISLAGLKVDENADLVFLINNFKQEQGDLVLGEVINSIEKKIDFPLSPFFVADVNNANGADCAFVEQMFKQSIQNLYGYCAYNTSANSIGCAILIALVKFLSVKSDSYDDLAFKKLMYIRLLDDWGYQAISRKFIRESAPQFDKALMVKVPQLNENGFKIAQYLNFYPEKIQYCLPWERSFEIRIKLDRFF